MKIKLTKAQIGVLNTERQAHLRYVKEQDVKITKLAKEFGVSHEDRIWDYIVNGERWTIKD